MIVAVAGSSGLIGTALKESLRGDGHRVIALVRREARSDDESSWDPAEGLIEPEVIARSDVVVNLAGASIGDKRLTSSYKDVVLGSRVRATSLLAHTMAQHRPDGVLIQGSAMGYYGDRGDTPLPEDAGPGETFLADVATAWEAAAAPAAQSGVRTVYLRSGLVLAPHGGFAERLLPLTTRGLLRSMGNGRQWHSWITLEDHVRAVRFLIDSSYSGPANLITPSPVRNSALIRALTEAAGRKPLVPVPAWVLRLVEGPAIEDLLSSQVGQPGTLENLGFAWNHADIVTAAAWVMEQR